jgi:hypothetical protein
MKQQSISREGPITPNKDFKKMTGKEYIDYLNSAKAGV